MGASSFNEMEKDALGEMMNISLGASATAMSTLLGSVVNITTPVVHVLTRDQFEFKRLEPAVGVEIAYVEGLEGSNIMMFSRNDVRIIVSTLMGQEIPMEQFELDEINRSAICEVMNQMMGASATAMSEFLKMTVNISTPVSFEIEDEENFKQKYFPANTPMAVVGFTLEIVGKLESEFLNIMPLSLAKRLLEPFEDTLREAQNQKEKVAKVEEKANSEEISQIKPWEEKADIVTENTAEEKEEEAVSCQLDVQQDSEGVDSAEDPSHISSQPHSAAIQDVAISSQTPIQPEAGANPQAGPVSPIPPYWGGMSQSGYMPHYNVMPSQDPAVLQLLTQMQQSQVQMMEIMRKMEEKGKEKGMEKAAERKTQTDPSIIRPSVSVPLDDSVSSKEEETANQEMLMRVPLEISVEIGRTKKLVKDILEFTQGSLVVLDKMAGEQADLYVNGQCVAKGDIVVVEDNFGIRITEIVACDLNQESL